MTTYPKIDPNSIWSMVEFAEAVKAEPEILTKDDLPYPEQFLDILRSYANKEKAKRATGSSIEDLEDQIAGVYDELDDFKQGLDSDQEGQIFVQYMRLRATLLTKMVEIKERVYNLKAMKAFQDRVLKALDKLCTPEQKTKLIEILEGRE